MHACKLLACKSSGDQCTTDVVDPLISAIRRDICGLGVDMNTSAMDSSTPYSGGHVRQTGSSQAPSASIPSLDSL